MFHPKGPTLAELARQALSSTTRGYDLLAPKFEYTPFRTPDELLTPLVDAALEAGPIDRVLDVCCGTGAVMRLLRPHARQHVVGVDLSQGMLDEARRLLQAQDEDTPFELVRGNALAMTFDQPFDVAASSGASGHIIGDDQHVYARRIHDALRPGGRFLFPTAHMPSPLNPGWWLARGFNAAMHVRNALLKPPFVMFYLQFTVERATDVLEQAGFTVDVRAPYADTAFPHMRLVVATRR